MHLDVFLIGAFVYLAAAVIAAPIATRLGLGSVLGYLIAGMALGPAAAGLIGGSQGESVMHFAEFGVIVMLFLVGLELQPSKLWELRKPILGLGGFQVARRCNGHWRCGLSAWASTGAPRWSPALFWRCLPPPSCCKACRNAG